MSSFTEPLDLRVEQREYSGRGVYTLLRSFEYHVGKENSGISVRARKNFPTDLATIPWFARWLISPGGLHAKAAVIHDWLYEHPELDDQGSLRPVYRDEADAIFLEAMEVLKVPLFRRWIMYYSVRLGGDSGFNYPSP